MAESPSRREVCHGLYGRCSFLCKAGYQTVKKAVCVACGIRLNGHREIMGIWIDGDESAKNWFGVLDEIKSRG